MSFGLVKTERPGCLRRPEEGGTANFMVFLVPFQKENVLIIITINSFTLIRISQNDFQQKLILWHVNRLTLYINTHI